MKYSVPAAPREWQRYYRLTLSSLRGLELSAMGPSRILTSRYYIDGRPCHYQWLSPGSRHFDLAYFHSKCSTFCWYEHVSPETKYIIHSRPRSLLVSTGVTGQLSMLIVFCRLYSLSRKCLHDEHSQCIDQSSGFE